MITNCVKLFGLKLAEMSLWAQALSKSLIGTMSRVRERQMTPMNPSKNWVNVIANSVALFFPPKPAGELKTSRNRSKAE